MTFRLFAVTSPGLELFTSSELSLLGITSNPPVSFSSAGEPHEESGGLEFEASLTDLYRVNLHLRTANRVIMRLGEFTAVSFPELRKKAARLPWESVLRPGQPIALRVTCHKSKLYHSDGVAERISGAIADHLGKPSPVQKFDENSSPLPQLIIVRFSHDLCTVSVDTSGELLHRRGYRLRTAKAPLRETLAAGLLLASGWNLKSPLIDPFCGSGTIAIEAALMARRMAPGKNRRFAFMDWPIYDDKKWKQLVARAQSLEVKTCGYIGASDRDAGAIQIAKENAERAGVASNINFECQSVSSTKPTDQTGWIVTNPPYGVRVSPARDLRDLYAQFGNVLGKYFQGWKYGVLCSSPILVGQMKVGRMESMPMVNGGIPVKLYSGTIEEI